MTIAAAIDKNHRAPLRIVVLWLVAALVVNKTRALLPLRISRWVGVYLFKLETATGYLLIAATRCNGTCVDNAEMVLSLAARHRQGIDFCQIDEPLCLEAIIKRLKAIRLILRQLSVPQKVFLSPNCKFLIETVYRTCRLVISPIKLKKLNCRKAKFMPP